MSKSFPGRGGQNSGLEEIEANEDELDLYNVRLSQKISKVLVLDQTPRDVVALNNLHVYDHRKHRANRRPRHEPGRVRPDHRGEEPFLLEYALG